MPELPEVRVSSSSINKQIKGQIINAVEVLKPKLVKEISVQEFKESIIGKTILKVDNKGKFIVFHLSDDIVMLSHLRMEGSYHAIEEEPLKHDRIIFSLSNMELAYNDSRMFGTFHIRTEQNYLTTLPVSKLGNEPQDIDAKELNKILSKKRIPIKAALLDQTLVLGLGNIYVNEALFKAKINPMTPSNNISLKQLKSVLDISAEIMDKSTSMGGTSIKSYVSFNDTKGGYQTELVVHGKKGNDCVVCSTAIEKNKVRGRGTYYCPKCQK